MQPVTGNDLNSYHGDASLAGGGGGNFVIDTSQANDYLQRLNDNNIRWNHDQWWLKKQHQDQVMQQLNDGSLDIGQVHPNDMPGLRGQLDDIKKFLLERHGDVESNPDDWIELNNKIGKFRNDRVYAQSRMVNYSNGLQDIAKEEDPDVRKKMQDWYDKQIGGDMRNPWTPYQRQMDYNWNTINKPIPTTQKILQVSADGTTKTVKDGIDIERGHQLYTNQFRSGDKEKTALQVNRYLQAYFGHDGQTSPEEVQQQVQYLNDRLKKVLQDEGYDIDNLASIPAYLKNSKGQIGMDVTTDPRTGLVVSAGHAADDWFKTQLAEQATLKPAYNTYDKSAMELLKDRSSIAKDKAGIALDYANIGLAGEKARTQRALADKYGREGQAADRYKGNSPNTIYDAIIDKAIPATQTFKDGSQKRLRAVFTNDLPEGMHYIKGMVPVKDVTGQANGKFTPGELEPFLDKKKTPYWKVQYRDQNGAVVDVDKDPAIKSSYQKNVDRVKAYNRSNPGQRAPIPTYEEFLKSVLHDGNYLKAEFVGKNGGIADVNSIMQSQLGISNTIDAGKEQNIFTPPSATTTDEGESSE